METSGRKAVMRRIVLVALFAIGCAQQATVHSATDGSGSNGGAGGSIDAAPDVVFQAPDAGFGFDPADASPGEPPTSGGPPSMTTNCGLKTIPLERKPADLLLVMDRSGSMDESIIPPGALMPVRKWDRSSRRSTPPS